MGCDRCDYRVGGETIDALGHTPAAAVKENSVPATCGAAGSYDSVVYCAVCKTYEISRTTVPVAATGAHNYEYSNITNDEHTKTCSVCGDNATEAHQYMNGACACGKIIDGCVHNYVSNVTAPTCGAAGYTTYTCSNCGDTYKRNVISATGEHDYDNGVITIAATCDKAGTMTYTCGTCGATKAETIAKSAHNYTSVANYGNGLHKFTCDNCDTTRTERHEFGNGNTCTVAGCGATKEHIFDGVKHEYAGAPVTEEAAPSIESNTFEAEKYTAKVEDVGFTNGGAEQALHTAYNEEMLYIAVELDAGAYAANDFSISIKISNGNSILNLTKAQLNGENSKVYTEGGKVIVAVQVARNLVRNASTGNNSEDLYLVFVTLGEETKELLIETNEDGVSNVLIEDDGDAAIDISGVYVVVPAEKVVSVTISWEIPNFVYTEEQRWDAENTQMVPVSSGWSTTPAKITVINNSNQGITATFGFTSADGLNIGGTFKNGEDTPVESVTLASADLINASVSDIVYFYVTEGKLTDAHEDNSRIGDITVTIRSAQ